MTEAITQLVKYVFLDVVKFTVGRSVEAQTEITTSLNDLVKGSVDSVAPQAEHVIFIPTGDGVCIASTDPASPYDLHLLIALEIFKNLDSRNKTESDPMRKFQVRIGINENVDNLVIDINGNRNVTGAGINMAQRIMNFADEGHILVGKTVHETLCQREKYMKSFKFFTASGKHGLVVDLYQFVAAGHQGLNQNTPSAFVTLDKSDQQLTLFEANYFALCIKYRNTILKEDDYHRYSAGALLFLLANDFVEMNKRKETDHQGIKPQTHMFGRASFEDQLKYYAETDYWLCVMACHYAKDLLSERAKFFENWHPLLFVNKAGEDKLKKEHLEIWTYFDLDHAV